MAEQRMLIVPEELVKKIDENRGDLSRGDFIAFLIDSQLKQKDTETKPAVQYATKDDVRSMEQDIKRLMKTFLDFFITYGMEIGKKAGTDDFEEIKNKLAEIDKASEPGDDKGKATIKWK